MNNRHLILRYLMMTLFLLWARQAWSASCGQVFPTGLASATNTGSITIYSGADINGIPSNQLVTKNLTSLDSSACNSSACSASNTNAQQATNFTSFPGGSSVYVNYQQTYSVASSTNYTSFGSNTLTVLNFAPGDFTINGNVQIGSETKLNVSATGTVRIFVNGNLDVGAEAQINMGTGGGTNRFIYFYTRGDFTMHTGADAKAVVYARGNVILNNATTLTGAVTSETNISMQFGATLNYSSSYVTNTNFGSSCTVGGGATINSFLINTGGATASTCVNQTITITAKDASNNTLTGYTGTVTLTTSTAKGNWSKTATASNANGALTPGAANSGQATYVFTAADAGDIVLLLSNHHAQTLTINVADNTANKNTTSSSLTFGDNAFAITATDTLADDLIAGRSHTLTATMWRRDPSTGNCAAASGYNVAGVKLWLTRVAGDPGGSGPTATNNAGNSSVVLPNTEPGANNINMNFSGGVANFRLLAADVGKYSINIKDASNSFSGSAITGNSSTLIARPFGFYIFGTGIPGASLATGSVFKKAGEAFGVSVRAVAWESGDDLNNDGAADGHQDTNPANNAILSNNSAVTNFGKEVGGAEQVVLSYALFAPAGGATPALTGTTTLTSFTSGAASTSNLVFNNVGIIELLATVGDGDYLGAGAARTNKIVGRSGYVGRFYPNAFSLTDTALTPACNAMVGFSYLGQTFTTQLSLSALTTTGAVATNYRNDFVKLANLTNRFGAVDLDSPTALTSRLVLGDQTYAWSAGVLDAEVDMSVARAAALDGPFTAARIGVRPLDSDGVALLPAQLNLDTDNNGSADMARVGSTQFRFGRLRLEDSYGPETANLPVRFLTEYWNGSGWLQNTDDSCTTLARTEIIYPQGAINNTAYRTVTVGGGTTIGQYAAINATHVTVDDGDAGHYFTAPGAGNTGTFDVEVDLTDYPWLRFDWNNDGNFNDAAHPSANFTFGSYRGHDRVLYWLEQGG